MLTRNRERQPSKKIDKALWTNGEMRMGAESPAGDPMVYLKLLDHSVMESTLCSPQRHKRCTRLGVCERLTPTTDVECSEVTGIPIKRWLAMTKSAQKKALYKPGLPPKKGFKDCRRVKLTIEEFPDAKEKTKGPARGS